MEILHRAMYTERSAADLLRVPVATLHYWLEGGTQGGRRHAPVIRVSPTGLRSVTWAEFVEASLLREYRRELGVPMPELRDFITRLRDKFGVPYPLADRRPWTSGKHLMLEAQEAAGLDADHQLVAEVHNQPLMLAPADAFLRRVRWSEEPSEQIAASWRPDDYQDSPVVVDPLIRFGLPTVDGIRTEILWEQAEAGEAEEDLAELYHLPLAKVRRAIAYEMATRSA